MVQLQRLASILFMLAFAVAVGVGAWWLFTHKPDTPKADKPVAPASVPKVVKEEDLNSVTLTPEAEKRIGLKLGQVETKSVRRLRFYGGEVIVPPGRTILVTAPLMGSLKSPQGLVPKPGQLVKAGQVIFQLMPMLTPEGKATLSLQLATADGAIENAVTQLELTLIALNRAKELLKGQAGSQRQVDEAQAAYDIALKTHAAAVKGKSVLTKVLGDEEKGSTVPINIDAPEDGLLRVVSALPGQMVSSNSPLFEIIDTSTIWVRVPLPVGDLATVDRAEVAQIGKLSSHPGERLPSAKPVSAPPSANLVTSTVDAFYEVANDKNLYTPGQRVAVNIALKNAKENLTVPWSAIVFDIHGGTWLYESAPEHKYIRRRVTVLFTDGPMAVLEAGPGHGTKIVIEGTQQLFGAETGFVK
jgi:membrane fusion protein, heavy metal efflux system